MEKQYIKQAFYNKVSALSLWVAIVKITPSNLPSDIHSESGLKPVLTVTEIMEYNNRIIVRYEATVIFAFISILNVFRLLFFMNTRLFIIITVFFFLLCSEEPFMVLPVATMTYKCMVLWNNIW